MKIVNAVLLVLLVFAFVGCDPTNGNDPQPKECECPEKAHLGIDETCCEVEAPNVCECELKVYATLGNINVYRKGDVNDMSAAVTKLETAYENVTNKTGFANNVIEVRIVSGSGHIRTTENGKYVVELGEDLSIGGMRAYLIEAADTPVARAFSAKSNCMFLATTFFWRFTKHQRYVIL